MSRSYFDEDGNNQGEICRAQYDEEANNSRFENNLQAIIEASLSSRPPRQILDTIIEVAVQTSVLNLGLFDLADFLVDASSRFIDTYEIHGPYAHTNAEARQLH